MPDTIVEPRDTADEQLQAEWYWINAALMRAEDLVRDGARLRLTRPFWARNADARQLRDTTADGVRRVVRAILDSADFE